MAVKRKAVTVRRPKGGGFRIPKSLLEEFTRAPIIDLGGAAGYWPIAPALLKRADFFKKLATDKQFLKEFDVMIVPKAR